MKTLRLLTLLAIIASASITLGQGIPDRYIAVFTDEVRDHPAAARALAAQYGLSVAYVYQHALKGFAFAAPPQAIAALARRTDISYIEPDQVYQAWGQTIPTGINRTDVDATGIIDGVDDVVDVDIAIIDTGLDSDHPDLRIDPDGVRFYSRLFRILSDTNWEDDNGHGTHVGGTAAAIDNDQGVVGVAPGARLTAVKVLDKNGSGTTSGVIAGVDWVAARADRFEVANMSLGGGYSAALNTAVANAVAKGVVFVVAAGNEDVDASTKSPASEPTAITVSALAESDGLPGGDGPSTSYGADDTFATFSNYGSIVDICAPGVDILSTYPGGYAIGSGTSMATPHVTGAAALYIAKKNIDPKNADDVAAIANALKTDGWQYGENEYFTGDADLVPEPLLNVGRLIGSIEPPVDAPLTVSITNPTNGATVSGTVTITADASDDAGVTQVAFFAGTESIGIDNNVSDGWSVSWNTTAYADGGYTLTAKVTDTIGQTTTSAPIIVTINNVTGSIHCGDLDGVGTKSGVNWRATVTATIHDSTHNPVSGARVTGTWSDGYSASVTGTTDANGQVSFTTGLISKKSTSVRFTLTGVALSGLTYLSGDNHDPDGNSKGTSIIVLKP